MLLSVISTLITSVQAVSATTSTVVSSQGIEPLVNTQLPPPEGLLSPIPYLEGYEEDYADYKRIEKAYIQHLIAENASVGENEEYDNFKVKNSISTADRVRVNLDIDKTIYSPGEVVQYSIQTTMELEPAVNTNVRLIILKGQTDNFWRFLYRDYTAVSLGLEVITDTYVTTDSNGFYYGNFTPTESDRYVIVIQHDNSYYWERDYRFITVSPICVFWRIPMFFIPYQQLDSYAVVLNTTDFTELEGADINVSLMSYDYDYENELSIEVFSGQTGANGLCKINITSPMINGNSLSAELTATFNGHTTTVSRWLWTNYYSHLLLNRYEFIVTTDKPIYQPGETIHVRALVRDNDFYGASKQPVPGLETMAEVKTPSRFLLLRKYLVSDNYGVVQLDIPLDIDTETGSYYLELSAGNCTTNYEIEVKKYEKPAFRVTITPDKEYVPPREYLSCDIIAEYYFGKPVTNGQVTVYLFWKEETTTFSTITGLTGSDGKFHFDERIPALPSDDYYYRYGNYIRIEASVEDPVERTVNSSTTVSISSDLYIWGYVNPWLPLPGDNLTIRYYSYQYTPQRLSEKPVTIDVYGVNLIGQKVLLRSLETTSNQYGSGSVLLSLSETEVSKFLKFYVKLEINPGDGRTGTDDFYFHYAVLGLDISLNKEVFNRGETVELDIDLVSYSIILPESATIRLYLSDPDYDTIYRGNCEISGSTTISLKLSDLAPYGKYFVYGYIKYYNSEYDYDYYYFSRNIIFEVKSGDVLPELTLSTEKTSYNSGETITIEGSFTGESNAPIVVELTKRGLVSVHSFDQSVFNIVIDGLEAFAPRFFVFAYAFGNNGIVYETYLVIEIKREVTIDVITDKDVYEPGETATVTIRLVDESGVPVSGLAAISFIDSSIFGVKEDPETELEYFETESYWSWMATTTNMKGNQPYWWYWWGENVYFYFYRLSWQYYDIYYSYGNNLRENWGLTTLEMGVQSGSAPGAKANVPDVEVRSNLPESMYWQPAEWIDGETTYEITLPDNIGEWTVRIVLTYGVSGEGVLEKATFNTRLPFFVEMTKPAIIKQDDVVVIKGVVYNYLEADVTVNVSIAADGFEILNLPNQQLFIPSNYLADVGWSLLASESGQRNVTIYAVTNSTDEFVGDAIQKTVTIIPNGITNVEEYSSIINGTEQLTLTVHNSSVSTQAFLMLSSGFGDLAIDSWQRFTGYPYGCVEQTISRLVPDAMILSYLNKTGQLSAEIRFQLENMIYSGLSRLYSFQHLDGAWGWWSNDQANSYMTAIVLNGLASVVAAGIVVDETVIERGINYLIYDQLDDGHWTTNAWRLDDQAFTANIVRALQQLEDYSDISSVILQGLTYLQTTWNNDENARNPYLAALLLQGFQGTGKLSSAFLSELNDYLIANYKIDSNGLYWVYNEDYYWRNLGGNVETTALGLVALYDHDRAANMLVIQDSINWITSQQKRWGWGSTADTATAIWAIMTLASGENEDINATAKVFVNSEQLATITFNSSSAPTAGMIDVDEYLVKGENNVTIDVSGQGSVTYYLRITEQIRAKPEITVAPSVSVKPGETFYIDCLVSPTASDLLLTEIHVNAIDWNFGTAENGEQKAAIILKPTTFTLELVAPGKEGIYQLRGVQVDYMMRFVSGQAVTEGLMSEARGPITVNVDKNAQSGLDRLNNRNDYRLSSLALLDTIIDTDLPAIKFNKTLSDTSGFEFGDTINVTLSIHSNDPDVYNFLVIEDFIPTGFVLDESSLQTSETVSEYTLTSQGVSFFLSEIEEGQDITINYRLTAINVLHSIVPSARLSQMYSDEWVVETEKYIIGDSPVLYDPADGALVRDFSLPRIEKFAHEQDDREIDISVIATDESGITRTKIYYKYGNSWSSAELEFNPATGEWEGSIGQFSSSTTVLAYVEVQDTNQNMVFSDIIEIAITVVLIIIPIIAIMMLIGIASGSGITAHQLIKRKLAKGVK